MTNEVKVLSDDALREIETRREARDVVWYHIPLTPTERDALCATVHALRAEQLEGETCEFCDEPTNDAEGNSLTFLVCGRCWNANEDKNRKIITALREQLAELRRETEWQKSTIEQLTVGVAGCAEQLAQVTQERQRLQKSLDDWASGALTQRELIGKVQQIANWQAPKGWIEIYGGTGPITKEQA